MYEDNRNYRGLNHCLKNLQTIIKEAIYLDRIPVISPPLFHPKHNFGIELTYHWEKYLNLSKTVVYLKDSCKFRKRQKPFLFIYEEDFKQLKFEKDLVNSVNPHHKITRAENTNYQLIVRSIGTIMHGMWWNAIPEIWEKIRIEFVMSEDVLKISRNVIDRLEWYAAIHVRRGDRLKQNKSLKKFTSPQHILKVAYKIVPLQSNIYILSNEKDRNYFASLKDHYKIYQYFDFEELNSILSCQEPDNYFLYMIEKCIARSAAKKILTFRRSSAGEFSLSKFRIDQYSLFFELRLFLNYKLPLIRKPLKKIKNKLLNYVNMVK